MVEAKQFEFGSQPKEDEEDQVYDGSIKEVRRREGGQLVVLYKVWVDSIADKVFGPNRARMLETPQTQPKEDEQDMAI